MNRRLSIKPSDVTSVILAGGLGTRLRSVVGDRQKVLAQIQGRPFLTFLLDQLISAGIRNVLLCTGYMADDVRKTLGDRYKSLKLDYSKEYRPLGTGGALEQAVSLVRTDPVLVMNGDSYIDVDLKAFLGWFCEKDPAAALVLTRVDNTSRYGKVILTDDDRIQHFQEKDGNTDAGWINSGVYLLRRKCLTRMPRKIPCSLERDFFPGLITQGLYGYRCREEFIDIGTPESYSLADDVLGRMVRINGDH